MIKLLIGGSPCTYWSIAQKKGRETKAEGMGWELFKNYLIAKEKFKPDFFLYENNKSAAQAIKDQIKEELGVWDGTMFMQDTGARYIEINSALVSAQNRQRFYVHNCGEVDQPEDRGILLRDVLEGVADREKGRCVTTSAGRTTTREYFKKHQGNMAFEPVAVPLSETNGKAYALTASYYKAAENPFSSFGCEKNRPRVAEPVGTGYRGRMENGKWVKRYESNGEEKANALTTAQTDSMVAVPIRIGCYPSPDGTQKNSQGMRLYSVDGKSVNITANGGGLGAKTGLYAIPVESTTVQEAITKLVDKYGYLPEMFNAYNVAEITDKAPTLSTGSMVTSSCAVNRFERISGYAAPCEWDEYGRPTKAISFADGKAYLVYEVKGGIITIKGKRYPIKLEDGFYIIRKLTPVECERLQTLPDGYTAAVSNTQRYRGLGNGWTAEVIIHILMGALKDVPRDEEIVVLSMYDGIGTGRYCLDKMGFTNVKYYAYEIDKYAKQVSMSNYPDIIQMGDAFDLRHPDWTIGY